MYNVCMRLALKDKKTNRYLKVYDFEDRGEHPSKFLLIKRVEKNRTLDLSHVCYEVWVWRHNKYCWLFSYSTLCDDCRLSLIEIKENGEEVIITEG